MQGVHNEVAGERKYMQTPTCIFVDDWTTTADILFLVTFWSPASCEGNTGMLLSAN